MQVTQGTEAMSDPGSRPTSVKQRCGALEKIPAGGEWVNG